MAWIFPVHLLPQVLDRSCCEILWHPRVLYHRALAVVWLKRARTAKFAREGKISVLVASLLPAKPQPRNFSDAATSVASFVRRSSPTLLAVLWITPRGAPTSHLKRAPTEIRIVFKTFCVAADHRDGRGRRLLQDHREGINGKFPSSSLSALPNHDFFQNGDFRFARVGPLWRGP